MSLQIVILPRGWVMVGDCTECTDKLVMKNASVIRRWGATGGLPQLANEGPQSGTKLDGKCEMEFPISSVIAQLKCNGKVWKGY